MNMNKTFKELFGPIQAEEELKNQTKAFLAEKTKGYARAKAPSRRYSLAAVCLCLFFALFGGHWLYFTPMAQISIDINPSIELSINRFDQVILVKDFNEDGRALSHALDVKYKNYADALEQIANNAAIAALLSDNEIMTITVAGPDKKQSAEILSGVEAYAAGQSNTYCYYASSEEVAQAHEMGFSCGKYKTFLELQQLNPDIDPEAVQEMTMREIRELIDHCSDDGGEDTPAHNPEENDHHGHGGGHQKGHGKGRRGRH